MHIETLNFPSCGTWSRDCLLISLSYIYNHELKISYHKDDDNTFWELVCSRILAFNLSSEEFSQASASLNLPVDGSFFEIFDSPWLSELQQQYSKSLKGYKHFVLQFYDETIQVLIQHIDFHPIEKPKNIPYFHNH